MSNLIRTAQLADLPQLKAIYNHAVAHSTATFDLYPRDDADRLAWFQAHQGKYTLLVCETDGVIAGIESAQPLTARQRSLSICIQIFAGNTSARSSCRKFSPLPHSSRTLTP